MCSPPTHPPTHPPPPRVQAVRKADTKGDLVLAKGRAEDEAADQAEAPKVCVSGGGGGAERLSLRP